MALCENVVLRVYSKCCTYSKILFLVGFSFWKNLLFFSSLRRISPVQILFYKFCIFERNFTLCNLTRSVFFLFCSSWKQSPRKFPIVSVWFVIFWQRQCKMYVERVKGYRKVKSVELWIRVSFFLLFCNILLLTWRIL